MKNKLIVIFCHSRASELDKCIISLKNAQGFNTWKLLVLQQYGNAKVNSILTKHRDIIDTSIAVKPKYNSILGNINYNRILGMKIAFHEFNADYTLGIEEDNLISSDALEFIDFVNNKYNKKRQFRGINLGSLEFGAHIDSGGFSLLRSGLYGSAGVLTRRTWLALEKQGYLDFDFDDPQNPWDAMIEFYLKSGFMVAPNLSKNLDIGYGGTFSPKSYKHHYFTSNEQSWIQSNKYKNIKYQRIQIPHKMKKDIIAFKRTHGLIYVSRKNKFITKICRLIGANRLISEALIKFYK